MQIQCYLFIIFIRIILFLNLPFPLLKNTLSQTERNTETTTHAFKYPEEDFPPSSSFSLNADWSLRKFKILSSSFFFPFETTIFFSFFLAQNRCFLRSSFFSRSKGCCHFISPPFFIFYFFILIFRNFVFSDI